MANLWDPNVIYDSAMASYWDDETFVADTVKTPLAANLVTGSVLEVHWTRTVPAGLREDLAMFTLHWTVEAGPGAPMSKLDASDAARVEAAFNSKWFTPVQSSIANDWTLKEYAWRHFGADFPLDKNGNSKPGAYWRLQPVAAAGTNALARLPDQIALTTTFRTASRKHWGRFYSGGWCSNTLADANMGHPLAFIVDQLAVGARDWFVDTYDDARKTYPVVWSAKYRGACTINEVSVDDTWDVIRSRRAKFPSYRKTYTS